MLGLLRVGHQATTLRGAGHQSLLFLNFPCRVAGDPNTIVMRRIRNVVLRSCSRLYYPILIYSLCSGSGAGEGYDTISGEVCACPLNGTLRLSPPFLDHIIRMFPPCSAQLMLHVCQSALLPTQESLQREKSHHRAIGVLVVGCQRTFVKFHSAPKSPVLGPFLLKVLKNLLLRMY